MLSQGVSTASAPQWVWIGASDATLFDEWKQRGVKVNQEPRNQQWAYEMKFEDLDGNVLWVGTVPRRDEPLWEGVSV